jgi:6-phosphogluconolactonase (cycloisomerase 2 family)
MPGSHTVVLELPAGWRNTVPVNTDATAVTYLTKVKDGVDGVDGLGSPWDLAMSPDGRYVYVCANGDDAVSIFATNPATGSLTYVTMVQTTDTMYWGYAHRPRYMAMSPGGDYLYVAADVVSGTYITDHRLLCFRRDHETGLLTLFEDRMKPAALDNTIDVMASSDGRNLYLCGDGNKLSASSFDPYDSRATLLETHTDGLSSVDGLSGVTDSILTSDGKYLYAAGYGDDEISTFERNPTTGRLTYLGVVAESTSPGAQLDGVNSIAISPDDAYVYATSYNDSALNVFARNATDGSLSFVQAHINGLSGVSGLGGAACVRVSADGRRVYVTGKTDDDFVAFDRDCTTGELTVANMTDAGDINGATEFVLSRDGRYAYVLAGLDNSLTTVGLDWATPLGSYSVVMPVRGTVSGKDFAAKHNELQVEIAAETTEGDAPTTASVSIPAPLASDLTVNLASSDSDEASVPASVVIPAGQTYQTFLTTIGDDTDTDGRQVVTVTASATGYIDGTDTMAVEDNDVCSFTWGTTYDRLAGTMFSGYIYARDVDGRRVYSFNGTVTLSAQGDEGDLPLNKTTSSAFENGALDQTLVVYALGTNVRLTASTATATGTSLPFDVVADVHDHFEWGSISSPQYLGVPFTVSVTACDQRGYRVAAFNGPLSFTTHFIDDDLLDTYRDDGIASGTQPSYDVHAGYEFVPAYNMLLARVAHYSLAAHVNLYKMNASDDWELVVSQAANAVAGEWAYTDLDAPIILSARARYRVVAHYPKGVPYYYRANATTYPLTIGDITINGSVRHLTTSDSPTSTPDDSLVTALYMVDLCYGATVSPGVDMTPVGATLVNGTWQGDMVVNKLTAPMVLRTEDAAGHIGFSDLFPVVPAPPMIVDIPVDDHPEDGDDLTATVSVEEPVTGTDLTVFLTSDKPDEATVPESVVIPVGATQATFTMTFPDDADLDGPEVVTVTAEAIYHSDGTDTVTVVDSETATLTVMMPASISEDAGTVEDAITVICDVLPVYDVRVYLSTTDSLAARGTS